ncbi:MAG TPA: septal ring lytic transglycosylase RlpA family protein [Caulobacterales bacterium]|nr:septal ring lytic transglycosylase RlpA family protein [Caulobacterales bacterium]
MALDWRRAAPVIACAQAAFLVLAAAPAHAQRAAAPITFASQNSGATYASLDGGAANSYGYGGARTSGGAPIDLRRAPAPSAPSPAAPAAAEGQGAPAWLEQERVGAPYQVGGRWYVPAAEPGYDMQGTASWYGPSFHGQATASGEAFDQEAMTAAHPTLPIPSLVQVTNLENGREVILRVNDRGPFVGDRIIDVSHKAAEVLGFDRQGQARVNVRYLGPAPRHVAASAAPSPSAAPAPPAQRIAASTEEGPRSLLPPQGASARADDTTPSEFAPIQNEQRSSQAAPFQVPAFGVGGYYVQVGAFADPDNAHRVEASIRSAGPVAVDTRQSGAGQLYRVRVGPFASPEQAAAAQLTLADLGYGQTILASR